MECMYQRVFGVFGVDNWKNLNSTDEHIFRLIFVSTYTFHFFMFPPGNFHIFFSIFFNSFVKLSSQTHQSTFFLDLKKRYEMLERRMPYSERFGNDISDPRISLYVSRGLRPALESSSASASSEEGPTALIRKELIALMQRAWETWFLFVFFCWMFLRVFSENNNDDNDSDDDNDNNGKSPWNNHHLRNMFGKQVQTS